MLKDRQKWLALSANERLLLLALGHHQREQVHHPVPTANVQFVSGMSNDVFEAASDLLIRKKLITFTGSNRSSIALAGDAFTVSLGGNSYRARHSSKRVAMSASL
ncbi:MAG: hypothetical protein ACYCY6_02730 [Minisyncoccota bacterium]